MPALWAALDAAGSKAPLYTQNAARFLDAFLDGRDRAVELLLVDLLQDFADTRTGCETERQHVTAEQKGWRRLMLDAERTGALDEPVHRRAVERPGAPEAVRACESGQQLQIDLLRQTAEGAVADVAALCETCPA